MKQDNHSQVEINDDHSPESERLHSSEQVEAKKLPDSGLACIAFLASFHGLSVDLRKLHHEFKVNETPSSVVDILRAAKFSNLKAKKVECELKNAAKLPTPLMFLSKDGIWRIFGGINNSKTLIYNPIFRKNEVLELEELATSWSGTVVLISTRRILLGNLGQFNLSWFIPSIIKYKKLFAEVLLASFFLQIFGLITPLFFQVIIDKVLSHKALATLDVIIIAFFAMSIFDVLLSGLRTWLFSHTAYRVDVQLGAKLFQHMSRLPIAYFNSRRVGDTVARVRELENLRRILTSSTLTVIVDSCFAVVFVLAMLMYSTFLTAIVVLVLPGYIVLSLTFTPLLRKLLEHKFARGAESQAFLVETINNIRTVKAMSVEPQFQRTWENNLSQYVRSAFKADNIGNIMVQSTQFLDKLTTILILWLGAKAVINAEMSVGQLIAFNMLAQRVSGPILRLAKVWQDLQQAGISMKRLGDILNSPTEPTSSSGKISLPKIKGDIRFENVFFRYRPDGPYILQNINFVVRPGEALGIVGQSGSGKSTMTNLLQRFYVPEQGKVFVDGMDLSLVDITWLRCQLGVVLQENALFNRSVRENIALTNPATDMQHIIHAAKLAGAHEFILDLPEGYDTIVGEHGATLSGGQRQRLAIARALINNPRILIFDEATSALDYESENIIQQNMRAICQGRTVVVIAHRLSTIMNCSRIIVVDKGRVIEEGSHKTLLGRDTYYKKLWEYQTKDLTS